MSSIITSLHEILPYLLVFWSIPFVVIAIKMVRRPTSSPHDPTEPAIDPGFDDRPWTLEEDSVILGETSATPPPSKHRSQSRLTSHFGS
jgi:hypothetical protein